MSPATAGRIVSPAALVLAAAVLVCAAAPTAAPEPAAPAVSQTGASDAPCAIRTTERIVAVGDIHGAYGRFVGILREAGILDARDRWAGGRAIFVQTGDVLDRGADSRRVLDLLRRLEGEAAKAGGAVHALLGNHEAMRLMRDLRDVGPGEYAAFRSPQADQLRERYYEVLLEAEPDRARAAGRRFDERAFRRQFLDTIPPGFVEMQIAFEASGPYGAWLRARDTMVKVNDIVFVHGGVSPELATRGCEAINAGVRAELQKPMAQDDPAIEKSLSAGPDGPLWYRGLALDDSPLGPDDVDGILRALGARTIVVGHTIPSTLLIRHRYDGRVVQIDTGMLGSPFYPGGRASALEIHGGTFTAIYEGRRQVILTRAGR